MAAAAGRRARRASSPPAAVLPAPHRRRPFRAASRSGRRSRRPRTRLDRWRPAGSASRRESRPASRASPVAANQAGGAACVASSTASAGISRPSSAAIVPGPSAATAQCSWTATPRRGEVPAKRCAHPLVMAWQANRRPSPGRSRYPGPAPSSAASAQQPRRAATAAIRPRRRRRRPPRCGARPPDRHRARRSSSFARNAPIGFTAMPCSAAPAIARKVGRDADVDRERCRRRCAGRPANSTRFAVRSSPVASAWMSRVPVRAASRTRSICASSARVDARDDAGQHAGIGRFQIAGHQRHPHARQRARGEGLEHVHMGMAAADEHDIGGDRDACGSRRRPRARQGGPAGAGRRRVS